MTDLRSKETMLTFNLATDFKINPRMGFVLKSTVAYIENQKEHHKKQTFQDEFRQFLRLNKIPYDEKYVWD
jgi:hypothetical protein